jgi:CelD/BcsL family acetyltransferase involved in cellulose biosynthesis
MSTVSALAAAAARHRREWTMAPATIETWEKVLASDPSALPSQTPAWVEAVCRTGAYAPASVQFRHVSGRHLVLPMVRRARVPSWAATHYSMPDRWGSGGLLVEDGQVEEGDVGAAVSLLAAQTAAPIVLVPNPRLDDHWAEAAPWGYASRKWSYQLDTSVGYDEVWSRGFRSSVRRAVRKAERSDVTVERDATGRLLPLFLPLYEESVLRWARDSGMPTPIARARAARLESLAKFEHVARVFAESCVTWMAFVDGRPAAGIVVLTHGTHTDYWRGAMDLDLAGPVRANDLLHARAIEEACAQGIGRYSFGISDPGSSLARFKEGFGATPIPYAGYVLERLPVRRTTRAARRQLRRGVVAAAAVGRRVGRRVGRGQSGERYPTIEHSRSKPSRS